MTTDNTSTGSKTVVTYPDGTERVFAPKGKIFTDSTVTDSGISTTVYLNKVDDNGVGVSQSIAYYFNDPKQVEFLQTVAAIRGIEDVIKSAVAGLSNFSDILDENGEVSEKGILSVVDQKLKELSSLTIVTRNFGSGSQAPLTKLERAYAKAYNVDLTTTDGQVAVKAWYEAIPKEDRKDISKFPELITAFAIVEAEIKRERAIALAKAADAVLGNTN